MKNGKGSRARRTESLFVRVTPEEKRAIEKAAHADDELNVSGWLRRLALQRVRRLAAVDRAS